MAESFFRLTRKYDREFIRIASDYIEAYWYDTEERVTMIILKSGAEVRVIEAPDVIDRMLFGDQTPKPSV